MAAKGKIEAGPNISPKNNWNNKTWGGSPKYVVSREF